MDVAFQHVNMNILTRIAVSFATVLLVYGSTIAQDRQQESTNALRTGNFRWRSSEPLLAGSIDKGMYFSGAVGNVEAS